MLEALVALGLAGNLIQLIQFSSELAKQTIEISRSGVSPPLLEIRHVTTSSIQQAEAIEAQIKDQSNQAIVSEQDLGLLHLVQDSIRVGKELLEHIDSLLPSPENTSKWQAVRKSIKIKFNQNKLDLYVKRLETLRSALSFDVVQALKKDIKQNHVSTNIKLNSIQDGMKAMTQIQNDMNTIITQLEGSRMSNHLLEATVNRCLERFWQGTGSHHHASVFQGNNTWLNNGNPSIGSKHHGGSDSDTFQLSTKEKEILRMLRFRQMTDRFEEVSPACRRTFDWIFQPQSPSWPWDSFVEYLGSNEESGPYWINGKAGSGKSTLMKYILENDQTSTELGKWAGDEELVIVPFFWSLGTSLQKSHLGLLRSLLHTIFNKHPELIREAFPSLWEDWKSSDQNYEPSYIEVKKGFSRLITESVFKFKMCIVIDGLDEFEGDHGELATFLRSLSSPRVKAIISSRPIPPCVAAFEDCASLRLQDLTQNDIKIFVKENLYQNDKRNKMIELERGHPNEARELVEEIGGKADGVFLWVKLVVKLLIEGLQNGDQISDLQRRLRSLPRDLKDLYKRMMAKMDDTYRLQAAEMFQIIRAWNSSGADKPLSTLLVSHATRSATPWINSTPEPLDAISALQICRSTEARIRSRCCGLVEVHQWTGQDDIPNRVGREELGLGVAFKDSPTVAAKDIPMLSSTIQYLHRSVAEFLYTSEIWLEICNITDNSSFEANACLAYASLYMLKLQRTGLECIPISVLGYVDRFVSFLRDSKTLKDGELILLLDSLDDTMAIIEGQCCYEGQVKQSRGRLHWSSHMALELPDLMTADQGAKQYKQWMSEPQNILTFAIRVGLQRYLDLKLEKDPSTLLKGVPLILFALDSWINCPRPPFPNRIEIMKTLAQNLPNPHQSKDNNSLHWQLPLLQILREQKPLHHLLEMGELIKCFALSGALPRPPFHETVGEVGSDIWSAVLNLIAELQRYNPLPGGTPPSLLLNEMAEKQPGKSGQIEEHVLGQELESLLLGQIPISTNTDRGSWSTAIPKYCNSSSRFDMRSRFSYGLHPSYQTLNPILSTQKSSPSTYQSHPSSYSSTASRIPQLFRNDHPIPNISADVSFHSNLDSSPATPSLKPFQSHFAPNNPPPQSYQRQTYNRLSPAGNLPTGVQFVSHQLGQLGIRENSHVFPYHQPRMSSPTPTPYYNHISSMYQQSTNYSDISYQPSSDSPTLCLPSYILLNMPRHFQNQYPSHTYGLGPSASDDNAIYRGEKSTF